MCRGAIVALYRFSLSSSLEAATMTSTRCDEVSSSSSKKRRLGQCEVCAVKEAVYSCPRCEVKTCCLDCVNIHKRELDCNGLRQRTKFLPKQELTEDEIMNDYFLLEECTRATTNFKNDAGHNCVRQNNNLPYHLHKLQQAAKERKTSLKFLSRNFTRHQQNKTYFDWKVNQIFWHIEWHFINAYDEATKSPICFHDHSCDEQQTLAKLLENYLGNNKEATADDNALKYQRELAYYQSAGINALKVLLRAEGIKNCASRYFELDVKKTLNENLSNKIIVEFPKIYVSYEVTPPGVNIIDEDEDLEMETAAHEEMFSNALPSNSKEHKEPEVQDATETHKQEEVDDDENNDDEDSDVYKNMESKGQRIEIPDDKDDNYRYTNDDFDLLPSLVNFSDDDDEFLS